MCALVVQNVPGSSVVTHNPPLRAVRTHIGKSSIYRAAGIGVKEDFKKLSWRHCTPMLWWSLLAVLGLHWICDTNLPVHDSP